MNYVKPLQESINDFKLNTGRNPNLEELMNLIDTYEAQRTEGAFLRAARDQVVIGMKSIANQIMQDLYRRRP